MRPSTGGVTSTEPLGFASTVGLATSLPPLPDDEPAIPPTANPPAASHNQLGFNNQSGAANSFPPNACGAKT